MARATTPVSVVLRRTGVTPDQLTGLGLVLAACAGAVIASGNLVAGALLIGFCGLADLLDGPLAKACDSTSVRGAFFDSVADRMSDIFVLTGLAWLAVSTRHGYLAVLALGVLAASMLPSYVRAKAETLGLSARGGIMERAERVIVLGLALLLQPFVPVLVPALWVILGLSLLTAVQRFASGWRQATVLGRPSAASPQPAVSAQAQVIAAAPRLAPVGARRGGDGRRSALVERPRHAGEMGTRWRPERAGRVPEPSGLRPARLARSGRPAARSGSRRQSWGGGGSGG